MRFELTVPLPTRRISSPVHSTALPTFLHFQSTAYDTIRGVMLPDCAGFVQNLVQLSGHRLKVVLRQVRVRPQHSLRLPTSGVHELRVRGAPLLQKRCPGVPNIVKPEVLEARDFTRSLEAAPLGHAAASVAENSPEAAAQVRQVALGGRQSSAVRRGRSMLGTGSDCRSTVSSSHSAARRARATTASGGIC